MLTTQGIIKRFGAVTVLDGIDFELQSGEVHALFGANGAGKSTLSKLIAGHLQPNGGQISLNGHACNFVAAGWRGCPAARLRCSCPRQTASNKFVSGRVCKRGALV